MLSTVKSIVLVTGSAALCLGPAIPVQAFVIYTDRASWQAAVDAIPGSVTTTDTFGTDIPRGQSITLESGIVSANSFPPDIVTIGFDNNAVVSGRFLNAFGPPASTASETGTWTFPGPIFAFGADFYSVNVDGLTLIGDFDGSGSEPVLVANTIGGPDGFLGIVGLADFDVLSFGINSTGLDFFNLDDASFASHATPVVPEPGTFLAAAVLGGAFLLRLRGQRR